MKQRQYTETQKVVMEVIGRLFRYINKEYAKDELDQIKKDYGIKEPYLTLREYIMTHCCGAYHTFHFMLHRYEISIDTLGDMLTDEWCSLYPLTNKYYVVYDEQKSNCDNCDNYHCDHYLRLEIKED